MCCHLSLLESFTLCFCACDHKDELNFAWRISHVPEKLFCLKSSDSNGHSIAADGAAHIVVNALGGCFETCFPMLFVITSHDNVKWHNIFSTLNRLNPAIPLGFPLHVLWIYSMTLQWVKTGIALTTSCKFCKNAIAFFLSEICGTFKCWSWWLSQLIFKCFCSEDCDNDTVLSQLVTHILTDNLWGCDGAKASKSTNWVWMAILQHFKTKGNANLMSTPIHCCPTWNQAFHDHLLLNMTLP